METNKIDKMKLETGIKVVGLTEGNGTALLIGNNIKAVTYEFETKTIGYHDHVEKATTFNAFTDVGTDQSDLLVAFLDQKISNEDINSINVYLLDKLVN